MQVVKSQAKADSMTAKRRLKEHQNMEIFASISFASNSKRDNKKSLD